MQHRTDAIDWWGSPAGPNSVSIPEWFLRDWDHDQVPNTVEDLLAGCKVGTWTPTLALGRDTWYTCNARPFDDVTDAEINAYWKGWTWPLGSVDGDDWSCGPQSRQWNGQKCGR